MAARTLSVLRLLACVVCSLLVVPAVAQAPSPRRLAAGGATPSVSGLAKVRRAGERHAAWGGTSVFAAPTVTDSEPLFGFKANEATTAGSVSASGAASMQEGREAGARAWAAHERRAVSAQLFVKKRR